MPPITIITKYAYDNHVHPGINFTPKTVPADRSLTNQADMDAADINKIMARYEKTGVLIDPLGVERKPMYGDFTLVRPYHQTLISIREMEKAFALLPPSTRNKFDNDVEKLVAWLDDNKNDAEAVKLGLKPESVLPGIPQDHNPHPAKPENPVPPAAPAPPPAG